MTIEEMQAEVLRIGNELNSRLAEVEAREVERQERDDKLNAEDRVRRKAEFEQHEARAEESINLHRRSVKAAEDLTFAIQNWIAARG